MIGISVAICALAGAVIYGTSQVSDSIRALIRVAAAASDVKKKADPIDFRYFKSKSDPSVIALRLALADLTEAIRDARPKDKHHD